MKKVFKSIVSSILCTTIVWGNLVATPVFSEEITDNRSEVTANYIAVTKDSITLKTQDNSALTEAIAFSSLEDAMGGTNVLSEMTLSDVTGDDGKNDTATFETEFASNNNLNWDKDIYLRFKTDTQGQENKYIYKKIKFTKIKSAGFDYNENTAPKYSEVLGDDETPFFKADISGGSGKVGIHGDLNGRHNMSGLQLFNAGIAPYYVIESTKGVSNVVVEYDARLATNTPAKQGTIQYGDLSGFVLGYNDVNLGSHTMFDAYKPGHPAYRGTAAVGNWTSTDIGYVEAGLDIDGNLYIGARSSDNDATYTEVTKPTGLEEQLSVAKTTPLYFNFVLTQNSDSMAVKMKNYSDNSEMTVVREKTNMSIKENSYVTIAGTYGTEYGAYVIDNVLVYSYEDLQNEVDSEYKNAVSDDVEESEIASIISANTRAVKINLEVAAKVESAEIVNLKDETVTTASFVRDGRNLSISYNNPDEIELDKSYKVKLTFVNGTVKTSATAFKLKSVFVEDFEGYNVGDKWSNKDFVPVATGGKDGTGIFYAGNSEVVVNSENDNKYLYIKGMQYPLNLIDGAILGIGNENLNVDAKMVIDSNFITGRDCGDSYGPTGISFGYTTDDKQALLPGYVGSINRYNADILKNYGDRAQRWLCAKPGRIHFGIRETGGKLTTTEYTADNSANYGTEGRLSSDVDATLEINYWKTAVSQSENLNWDNSSAWINGAADWSNDELFNINNYGFENTVALDKGSHWSQGTYEMTVSKIGSAYELVVENNNNTYTAETKNNNEIYYNAHNFTIAFHNNSKIVKLDDIKIYITEIIESAVEWIPEISDNTVNVQVSSIGQSATQATVIVAWYGDKDEMIDCNIQQVDLNTTDDINPVNVSEDAQKVICYLWDDIDDLKAILPSVRLK